MTFRIENRTQTYDTKLVLSYSANHATAQPGKNSTGATTQYVDLSGEGYTEGKVIFDVTTLPKLSGTAMQFALFLQGGKTSTFTSRVPLAVLELGDSATPASAGHGVIFNISTDAEERRYIVPFHNEYGGEHYRYLRTFLRLGNSIATGITYSAFITQ